MESFELLVDQVMMKRKFNRIEYQPPYALRSIPEADRRRERMKMSSKRECLCDLGDISREITPRSQGNELLSVLIGVKSEIKCSCEDSCSSSGEMLRIAGSGP